MAEPRTSILERKSSSGSVSSSSARKEEAEVEDGLPRPPLSPLDGKTGWRKWVMWFKSGDDRDGEIRETKRAMQSRHLMMIAIGGTIGTGIFLSAGSAIALAGPGSALLSYFVVGLFVYTVVIALAPAAPTK